jgi:hypothetical protein
LSPPITRARAASLASMLQRAQSIAGENVMGAEPLSTDANEQRQADLRQALDAAWQELDCALSTADARTDDPTLESVPTFLSSDALIVIEERRVVQPPALPGRLVHQRHDSSMLFSTTTFREIAMTAMRDFAVAQPGALVTEAGNDARAPEASATIVPIVVPATSALDKWLWRSLTVATVALLFFFVAALDLLIVGGRLGR